jgi:hypothetical protein
MIGSMFWSCLTKTKTGGMITYNKPGYVMEVDVLNHSTSQDNIHTSFCFISFFV